MATINYATFDTTSIVNAVGGVAGKKHKIVAFSVHNNETDFNDNIHLRIKSSTSELHGGSVGAIQLSGRGDHYFVGFCLDSNGDPEVYYTFGTNTAITIASGITGGVRISGWIAYITE